MARKRNSQVASEEAPPAAKRSTRSSRAPKRDAAPATEAEAAAPRKRKSSSRGKDAKEGTVEPPAKRGKAKNRSIDEPEISDVNQEAAATETSIFTRYPISKVYRLIEPGPVLLVTTGSLAGGTHNIMTIGFHMVMQHESPPLIGICLGPWDASFIALKKHRECVLAVPSVEMAGTVVDVGNCSLADDDGGLNKWTKFGLEALPAKKVKAPLVGGRDVMANVECVVEDTKMVGKYSMWVLRVVEAWENPEKREKGRMFHHRGDGTFVVDGEVLDLQEKMVKWKEYQD
ncbi:hypothetical protein B0H11DRAFT_632163 [Mycena galericulata]|nr:hypothetical protein B0H11DRAFT_632163 [Mycena galericulata]